MGPRFLSVSITGLLLIVSSLSSIAQVDTLQQVIPGRSNAAAQQQKPYVVIISADGFRYDYAEKYNATNLLRLAGEGVRAESMIPSYPSVTQPNHFALMSGLYPAHSGIVGNDFYDPAKKANFKAKDGSFFGEEPIWVTAEKQQLLTASFYWPASSTPIKGIQPTYFYNPNPNKDVYEDGRVIALKNWLGLPEEKRPHFISIYFPDTDHAGHDHGPDAPETKQAVAFIDETVGKLAATAKASGLPVNFVFIADHGMSYIDREHLLSVPEFIGKDKFVVTNIGATVNIHAKNKADILPAYDKLKAANNDGFDVYLKKDVPEELHYGEADDKYGRVGDIVLLARWPKTFNQKAKAGAHGYNPIKVKEMHATFIAWGPAFKEHLKIASFKNVEVYEVMMKILGMTPLKNDGTGKVAEEILKKG
jgi:predicted AlkP superfamily pyrophosphatase or phosphodiesterase